MAWSRGQEIEMATGQGTVPVAMRLAEGVRRDSGEGERCRGSTRACKRRAARLDTEKRPRAHCRARRRVGRPRGVPRARRLQARAWPLCGIVHMGSFFMAKAV